MVRWLTAASLPLDEEQRELDAVLDPHFRWAGLCGAKGLRRAGRARAARLLPLQARLCQTRRRAAAPTSGCHRRCSLRHTRHTCRRTTAHCRWHDAYGIWPCMHQRDKRWISRVQALQLLQRWHSQYASHCTVVDVAVAAGANAAFSHWQLEMLNRETEEVSLVEGALGGC